MYYRLFALLYGLVGSFSQATMVNSSWTMGHIQHLWWGHSKDRVALVYPPVDTEGLEQMSLDKGKEAGGETRVGALQAPYLVSVAQFRPEKNHRMQLEAFAMFKQLTGWCLE
jgi:alpha-1,2-mannosyltransferase